MDRAKPSNAERDALFARIALRARETVSWKAQAPAASATPPKPARIVGAGTRALSGYGRWKHG